MRADTLMAAKTSSQRNEEEARQGEFGNSEWSASKVHKGKQEAFSDFEVL